MFGKLVSAVIVVAAVVAGSDGGRAVIGADTAAGIARAVIHEDMPGWDCRIHGNRVCGPGSGYPPGRYTDGGLITPSGLETDTGAYVGGYN